MIIRERTGVVVLLGAVALAVAVGFVFRDVVRGPATCSAMGPSLGGA